MDRALKQQPVLPDPLPGEPSLREHGVFGYTTSAVGGFGEGYDSQVAHGGPSDSPGAPSESERAAHEAAPESTRAVLVQAVLKNLARAHIDAADLRVEAVGSEVRLHGTVRHGFEKAELEARARMVPGVTSVVSDLVLLRGDSPQVGK
ncbi:MAG TPA: BON domain-containing protein [Polyangiaceae bacterium]|jgi:hypothetical protein|nr:BON domain-containing protein [Polyangiaceae bacterium]